MRLLAGELCISFVSSTSNLYDVTVVFDTGVKSFENCASVLDKEELLLLLNTGRLFAFKIHSIKATIYYGEFLEQQGQWLLLIVANRQM